MVEVPAALLAVFMALLTTLVGLEWRRLRADIVASKSKWARADRIVSDMRGEVNILVRQSKGDDRALRSVLKFLSRLRVEVWPEGKSRRGAERDDA